MPELQIRVGEMLAVEHVAGGEHLLDLKTTKALTPGLPIPAGRTVTLAERIRLEGAEGNVPARSPSRAPSAAPGLVPRFINRDGHMLEPARLGPPSRLMPADGNAGPADGKTHSHVSFAQHLATSVASALPPEPAKKAPSLKERIAAEGVAAQMEKRPAR